jgi:hypothetical protein
LRVKVSLTASVTTKEPRTKHEAVAFSWPCYSRFSQLTAKGVDDMVCSGTQSAVPDDASVRPINRHSQQRAQQFLSRYIQQRHPELGTKLATSRAGQLGPPPTGPHHLQTSHPLPHAHPATANLSRTSLASPSLSIIQLFAGVCHWSLGAPKILNLRGTVELRPETINFGVGAL